GLPSASRPALAALLPLVAIGACSEDGRGNSAALRPPDVKIACGGARDCAGPCCFQHDGTSACAAPGGACAEDANLVAFCDGPEDCTSGGVCCFRWGHSGISAQTYCASAGGCAEESTLVGSTIYVADIRVCHVNADCPPARPACEIESSTGE